MKRVALIKEVVASGQRIPVGKLEPFRPLSVYSMGDKSSDEEKN